MNQTGRGGTNPTGWIQIALGNTDRLTVIGCNDGEKHKTEKNPGRARVCTWTQDEDADQHDSGECSVQ